MKRVGVIRAVIAGAALAAAAGTMLSGAAQSGGLDAKVMADALHWRLVGPFRAGRVNAVTGVPGQLETFYFGSVGGGVWKSDNAGRTWNPISDSMPTASIGAIAVAPSDTSTVYVGTGEADMRDSIAFGDGMYKSTDAGRTWAHIGLETTRQIGRIAVHPRDPNIVFVAALGHVYGPHADRGVYRSKDGGATWEKVLYKDDRSGAIDVVFDRRTPTRCMRRSGPCSAHRGSSTRRRTCQAAVSTSRRTAAPPGRSSRTVCRPRALDAWASAFRPQTRGGSM